MPIPTQVQELIDGSGNSFHAKVARWFASQGWHTAVSPYYMDQTQQKARELDLVVEKSVRIEDGFRSWRGDVVVRLFVECKYVPGYSVFWFTEKNLTDVEAMVCAAGWFKPNNTYTAKHHYLAAGDRVAKLFASSNTRGQDAEPFYKALNQALNGLVSLRAKYPKASQSERGSDGIVAVLDFPVVVCNSFSNVFAADFDGKQEPSAIRDNFQLEVQYAYVDPSGRDRNDHFLLDFVEYDRLQQFADAVHLDAEVCGFFSSRAM